MYGREKSNLHDFFQKPKEAEKFHLNDFFYHQKDVKSCMGEKQSST
jgi:hypothetical protein